MTPCISCLFLWCFLVLGAVGSSKVIHTSNGPVKGVRRNGVTAFHGIPFAAPPTKDLRWRPPMPPTPWTAPLLAVLPSICPQADLVKGVLLGKEDCLRLSVYVPDACMGQNASCAVMHWIHGGAWILGSNTGLPQGHFKYNGAHLANEHGVVVIGSNYRLDSLGWLAIPEQQHESPAGAYGNFGLLDQQAALRWTQANAANFGGDPDRVTIFGESAGGFSVCQHLVLPGSNRLFSRAIMESGDCDGPWLIMDGQHALRWGEDLASAVGCNGTHQHRLDCLRNLPLKEVLLPYSKWLCNEKKRDTDPFCNFTGGTNHHSKDAFSSSWPSSRPPFAPIGAFIAVVDGVTLPDVPLRLIEKGKVNVSPSGEKLQVIMGTNTDELALFVIQMPLAVPNFTLPITDKDFVPLLNHLMQYHSGWNDTTKQQVLMAYPRHHYKHAAARFIELGTDFVFRCGTRTAVRALAKHDHAVYLYQFNFKSERYKDPDTLLCELKDEVGCGVFHGAETDYVFSTGSTRKHPWTQAQEDMAISMGQYWTAFAKSGDPNGFSAPKSDIIETPHTARNPWPVMHVRWPRYNESTDRHLILANRIQPGHSLAKKHCDFWDSLPRQGPYHH